MASPEQNRLFMIGISLALLAVTGMSVASAIAIIKYRLQNFIDRRFYRRKYDAEQTLAQFAISARDEVDLDELTAELVRVVDQTIQPESVRLWLKE